jgi:ubiquinone/menaquinone biosynthesis C-methylase UbiE
MMASAAFDRMASRYDELWTNSDIGRLQREAVWRLVDPLFREGARVIDLGCGTGEDALHFSKAGVRVSAFDASPEMVRVARGRGVNASVLSIEELEWIDTHYDGAFSNFGAFNCVRDLRSLQHQLVRLIRPGGYLAICVIGRFCLWETVHYMLGGQVRKAARRWLGKSESASLRVPVYYPGVRQIQQAFAPRFHLVRTAGIGVCVPPSYVPMSGRVVAMCDAIDRRIAHRPVFRALADHRLLLFVRI